MNRKWIEGELSVFLFDGEYHYLGGLTQVKSIDFLGDRAVIQLSVPLPEGFILLRCNNNSSIILQDTIYGQRDVVNKDMNSIVIENIEIERRWIENIKPNGQDYIIATIIATGNVWYD